jgi:hypothetical protein
MPTESEAINVLVVGDWVVDENWIIAKHDAETSAHVGEEHFRSLVDHVDSQVLSLCGAGNVARSLHGLSKHEVSGQKSIDKALKVFGLGLWHPDDTKLLASLFSNYNMTNQTPLTLSGLSHSGQIEPEKYSLCSRPLTEGTCIDDTNSSQDKLCNKLKKPCYHLTTLFKPNKAYSCGTTRVIRLFKASAGGVPQVLYRIDWQVPYQMKFSPTENKRIDRLLWKEQMHAIVVHDFHKGAINKDIIQILLNKYPEADWFIRTKKMDVEWIKQIPENKFKLMLIGADYIPSRSKTKRWFYNTEVNPEAIKELMDLALMEQIKSKSPERWVIAVNADNRMLALHKKAESDCINGICITNTLPPHPINIGRSSIIFASCVASILGSYNDCREVTTLMRAYSHAYNWSKSYSEGIRTAQFHEDPRSLPVYPLRGDFSMAIKPDNFPGDTPLPSVGTFKCNEVIKSWGKSFKDCGIVEESVPSSKKPKKVFYLWRGYSCIDGYIAIRHDLREKLNSLYQCVDNFLNKSNRSSTNILILGQPGWGKTFLAEKLADSFELNPLFFNVSHLTSLNQIVDCFDAISSIQNQQKNRIVLAFFDEIDAKLEGQYTFSLFLSPMLDGTYRRGGHVFSLSPCIWMFAGSRPPLKIKDASKTRDFISRINGPTLSIDFGESEARRPQDFTEQVYIGVELLQRTFKDVSWVSENVLRLFHDLKMNHGVRSLQQTVRKFRNVQHGKIGRLNFPVYSELENLIKIGEREYYDLQNDANEKFIEIRKLPY